MATPRKNPADKKTPGRKPMYRETFCAQAEAACAEMGATNEKLGKLFGVDTRIIVTWMGKYPEFGAAVRRGKDVYNIKTAEDCLNKRIEGYRYPEKTTEIDGNGKIVSTKTTTKHQPPDTTSIIFFLKNRDPKRWRDSTSTDVTVKGAVEVTSPEISEKLKEIYSGIQKAGGADGP